VQERDPAVPQVVRAEQRDSGGLRRDSACDKNGSRSRIARRYVVAVRTEWR